ncbi:MAG: amidophosphoribosyltransferase [Candidatus Izemoplasmatales bacterium]|jgi:amidophosphoribosyltransferase|nr:amidophosphoribosyltransferase [Candidatus Izemoplasmatales bacterium]NLF49306.1 amidophosphoribosyltransferase [Acholeplasmataceae bacterium]
MVKTIENRQHHEECGVFGIFNHPDAANIVFHALNALQHRGQEGAGIIASDGSNLRQRKNEGLVRDVFKHADFSILKGPHAIGHVRYSTSGHGGIMNVQPLLFHSQTGSLGLCHNGNIVNALELKAHLEQQGSIFQTTSDTEIIAHLIKRQRGTLLERLKESLLYLEGAFAFLLLTEDELYIALDKHGLRPLSLGQMPSNAWVVASETCAFEAIGATFVRDVHPGEVIRLNLQGLVSDKYAEDCHQQMCMMEYVYFARPDSLIEGISVYHARKACGRRLAVESPAEADMVIGVPDSGMSAAVGYSEAAQIPLELGMIKNKSAGRTFIEPSQDLREEAVGLKISAIRSVVQGKRVVLIDDSIVRGTTIMQLIKLLKQAGATAIHVRIASPEIRFPCFYGVDFSTYDELISAHKTSREVKDIIQADSLAFLSVKGMVDAVGRKPNQHCLACFNGRYPIHLYQPIDEANLEIK